MDDVLKPLEHMPNAPIAPPHAIAGLALTLAMKYTDINTVKDGALYQQYKLEGKNMRDLHLDSVFEVAMQIEKHLLTASDRFAELLIEYLPDEDGETQNGEREDQSDPA